jgi:hypothetical protein
MLSLLLSEAALPANLPAGLDNFCQETPPWRPVHGTDFCRKQLFLRSITSWPASYNFLRWQTVMFVTPEIDICFRAVF